MLRMLIHSLPSDTQNISDLLQPVEGHGPNDTVKLSNALIHCSFFDYESVNVQQ